MEKRRPCAIFACDVRVPGEVDIERPVSQRRKRRTLFTSPVNIFCLEIFQSLTVYFLLSEWTTI